MDKDTCIEKSAKMQHYHHHHHPLPPPLPLPLSPLAPPPPPAARILPSSTATAVVVDHDHHLHQTFLPNHRHHRTITIFASIALFWSTVSLIPIYNKFFLQKEYYPYPMATTGIQLLCVSLVLTCVNVGYYYYCYYYYHYRWLVKYSKGSQSSGVHGDELLDDGGLERESGGEGRRGGRRRHYEHDELQFLTEANNKNSSTKTTKTTTTTIIPTLSQNEPPTPLLPSYIFGPNLLWKLYIIFPVGFLFGLKLAIMNLGLHLLPTPTHLLLQSTDIIWTVLGAWFINGEQSSTLGTMCLCGCFVGTFILSIQVGRQHQQQQQQHNLEDGTSTGYTMFAIGVNLISPMLMGLCVATLRSACVELMMDEGLMRRSSSSRCSSSNRDHHRVSGSVGSVELTAIKTGISAIVALTLASIFESARGTSSTGKLLEDGVDDDAGWYHAFRSLSSTVKLDVLGGSLPTLIFQVNCTFLAHLTSTVAVGLVGQLKIIPQWTVAMIFSPNAQFHMTGPNIFGALLTMASAVVFAINEYMIQNSEAMMQSGEEKIELLLSLDITDEEGYAAGRNGEMNNMLSSALVGIEGHETSYVNYGSILR